MARIRTIKPEFFTSEDVVALSAFARLLYIALWCEADKEGRLVWKPKTFKMRYFPADAVDAEALCKELTDSGLVVLYGDGYAYIPTFKAHQHINPRESASQLPEPTRGARVSTRHSRDSDVQGGREGKGSNTEANASGAEAPKDPADFTRDELWAAGKSLLQQAGTPKAQCGSIVGKLVKDYGDAVVVEAVRAAVIERPADPVAFLKAVCQHSVGERKPAQPMSFAQQDEAERRRRWEQMTGRKWPSDDTQPPDFIDVTATERIDA
jgi:hypothetical protein